MDFFDVIIKRRSIRKYKSDPVRREDILKILDAANWAPSASNKQPWEFLVVSAKDIKAKLGSSYGKIAEDYTKDWDRAPRNEIIQLAKVYGGVPVVIVVLAESPNDPQFRMAFLKSACAAMENMLLAATALGLGSCWMTGPLADEQHLRKLLAIPEDREIVALSPLGYPALIPEPGPRLDPDLSKKVRWLE